MAEETIAHHQRDVADVGTGQHLPYREHFEELILAEPAPLFHEDVLCDREVAGGVQPVAELWRSLPIALLLRVVASSTDA